MSTTLFERFNVVRDRVINYLISVNENINWVDFFNKYSTYPDTKILKRIRSLVWIDKTLDYDSSQDNITKYFRYYLRLLSKFMTVMNAHGPIYIIPPTDKNNDLLEEFYQDIMIRFSVLKRILKIMNISFEVIEMNSVDPDKISRMKLLIPIGSICYEDLKVFEDNFKGITIPDGYDNICVNEEDEIYNTFVLNIKALMMSADDVAEIKRLKFNMFYVKEYSFDK